MRKNNDPKTYKINKPIRSKHIKREVLPINKSEQKQNSTTFCNPFRYWYICVD